MALSLLHSPSVMGNRPIKNARCSILVEYRDTANALTNPTSPDTQFSVDGGASFMACAEEVSPTAGKGYITLTGAEMNNAGVEVNLAGTGVLTSSFDLYPADFPVLESGTAQAGGTITTIVLASGASSVDDYYNGAIIRTTGGTGGGGVGGLKNQAREVLDYVGSTRTATVRAWEIDGAAYPDATTTYDILVTPEWVQAQFQRTVLGIPAAAPDAAGGLPISNAGSLDIDAMAADVVGLDGAAMRGTDGAALASAWTGTRAGYIDNLSAGAVALASGVDLTSIHGSALTETQAGYLAAAFVKLFNVATPLLVASDAMRGTDSAATAAKLLAYVQLLARSDAAITTDRATELGEINANQGSGAGDFAATTDSQEAQVDVGVNMKAISGDSDAADNLETMLDGTGGKKLTLEQLVVDSSTAGGAVDIDNSMGPGVSVTSAAGGSSAVNLQGGGTGHGLAAVGGPSSGDGIYAGSCGGNGYGIWAEGWGAGNGIAAVGGATGHGMKLLGGATSGDGLNTAAATSGDGISATGAGTGDGIEATKGASGADIDADIAGTITTATSLTNAVALTSDERTTLAGVVWNALTSGMTTVGSIGKKLADWTILTSQAVRDALKLAPTAGDPAAGSIDKHEDDIQAKTDLIPASGIATAANQTTILARLGTFTGSGLNTVLGFLRAMAAKAAGLTPSDLSSGTTYDNTQDSPEAIRDRGDAAWITGGATGTNTVNFTVTVGGASLQGATIAVRATAGGANLRPGLISGTAGTVSTGLDTGTYYVQATLNGYSHTEAAVVVNEDPEAVAIAMTAFSAGTPATPGLRRVWMRTWDAGGNYVTGRPAFTVTLDVPCKYTDGRVAQVTIRSTDYADHSYAYADLLPTDALTPVDSTDTVKYRVLIAATGEDKLFTLATGDLSSVELTTLTD